MVQAGYPKRCGGVQNADGIPAGGVYQKFRNAMEISLQENVSLFISFSPNMIFGANDICHSNRSADAAAPRMDLSCAASVPNVLDWSHRFPAARWFCPEDPS